MNLKIDKLVVVLLFSLLLLPQFAFADAIMFQANETGNQFQLKKVNVSITVEGEVATVAIDQVFDNNTGYVLSGYYYFPLPDQATITGFGDYFTGELKYYELTYAPPDSGGGNSEVPTGWSDLRYFLGDNPFAIKVPDCPQGEFTVRLEYTMMMEYDFGHYRMTYPFDCGVFSTGLVDTMKMDVSIHSEKTITNFLINDTDTYNDYLASDSVHATFFYEALNPVTDIPMELVVEPTTTNMRVWTQTLEGETDGYFYAVLDPGTISPGLVNKKCLLFLFDASDSMTQGPYLDEAKEATNYCLSQLQPNDVFNVIIFGGSTSAWKPAPVLATEQNIATAQDFVSGLWTTGGTDLNGALMEGLSQFWSDSVANQIMILTDGEPWCPPGGSIVMDIPTIMENIRTNNTHMASIFTVAFGQALDYQPGTVAGLEFLQLISVENNGLHTYIKPGTEDIAGAINNFYLRFASPVIHHLSFTTPSTQIDSLYFPPTYGLFAGSQTSVCGRYTPGNSEIVLDGKISGRDTTLSFGPFDFPATDTTNQFVPRIWAMRGIDYYLAYMDVYGEDDALVEWITNMSMKFMILTPYTEFSQYTSGLGEFYATAAYSERGVLISWAEPEKEVEYYNVYRREIGGRSWLKLNNLPLLETSFVDRTALAGWDYEYMIEAHYSDGSGDSQIVALAGEGMPEGFSVSTHPNPFNDRVTATVTLPKSGDLQIRVYNTLGQKVAELHNGRLASGKHVFSFVPKDIAGGVYFLQISSGSRIMQTQRILYLK